MVIFRVYVSLLDIEPPIWRRIELSGRTTLKQLHRILQIAMGWSENVVSLLAASRLFLYMFRTRRLYDSRLVRGNICQRVV